MKARWYIIHAYSGFEKKVAAQIEEQARLQELEALVEQVLVPTEEVIEIRKGKKVASERKFFPGYVLIKMILTDETYHLVSSQSKVTGFLGSGASGRPSPVSDAEVARILNEAEEGATKQVPNIIYEVGEEVKVIEGPFTSFNGIVEEVDEDKARLKVSVSIFGRATPVELDYTQVEKSDE